MMSTTPPQRTSGTSSCKMNFAASVVSTNPSAVSGQMKLTSPCDINTSSVPKNTASKNTPSRMFGLVAPALTTRNTSAALMRSTWPTCLRPLLRYTTPTASNMRPTIKGVSSFAILQILVADELNAQPLHQVLHGWTDQGIKLVLKFI